VLHAGFCRSVHGCLVLRQTLAGDGERVGADDQKAIDASESGFEACRIVEIGLAGGHAPGGERREFRRVAGGGDDASGRNLVGFEQVMNDAPAKLAGRAGDENRFAHRSSSMVVSKREQL
jgi:hypothetical protein